MSRKSRLEEKRQHQAKGRTNVGDVNNPGSGAPRQREPAEPKREWGRAKNRR